MTTALHQAAGVAAAVAAHQAADGVAGGVEAGDRLLVLIERLPLPSISIPPMVKVMPETTCRP